MASILIFSLLCLFVFGILALAVIVVAVFKRVPENEKWVVTRFGETTVIGPGRVFQIPLIDQVVRVDMSQKTTNIQDQTCITRDRASAYVHMLVYSHVVDPIKFAIQTNQQRQDFMHLASSSLKEMVSARLLDQILSARDELGSAICDQLNGELDPALGVRIDKVKIMEIVVSKEILAAMAAPAEFPSECPACGAPVNASGSRGQRQVKCGYCGFLIKL